MKNIIQNPMTGGDKVYSLDERIENNLKEI